LVTGTGPVAAALDTKLNSTIKLDKRFMSAISSWAVEENVENTGRDCRNMYTNETIELSPDFGVSVMCTKHRD
jgi:hypothetical protein